MNLDVGRSARGGYPPVTAFLDPGYGTGRSGIPGMGAVDSSTMPTTMTGSMPSVTATAEAVNPAPQGQILPTDFMQRLPSIVNPSPVQVASGGPCDSVATWVSNNPLLAILSLGVLGVLVFRE